MSRVSFRDFNGEIQEAELAAEPRGPAVSLRRTQSGQWLLRLRTEDTRPVYVRIHKAVADAIMEALGRIPPADPSEPAGPTDPPAGAARTPATGVTPDPPPLDRVAMELLRRLRRRRAFDAQSAVHQDRLARDIGHPQGTRFRKAIDNLTRHGLIATRRRLGTWLTESGRAAAARNVARQ